MLHLKETEGNQDVDNRSVLSRPRQADRFFEGWYHKHQIGEEVYAFIPGLSIQEDGTKEVFIQVINHEGAHYFSFPETDFQVSEEEQ